MNIIEKVKECLVVFLEPTKEEISKPRPLYTPEEYLELTRDKGLDKYK